MGDEGVVQEASGHRRYTVLIGIGIVLVILLVALSVLFSKGVVKSPSSLKTESPSQAPEQSTVDLETKYDNPFDTKTQYVNPFSSYKNPFDTLK